MILIADSGSTKTDWCCIHKDGSLERHNTQGLNPNFTQADTIAKVINDLPYPVNVIKEIHFYGSGCGTSHNVKTIEDPLLKKYPTAKSSIISDIIGAARACLGDQEGIIAILGTGSNTGVYNGTAIIEGHPSLGFLLGDYGGGVDIGKQLLRDYFYGEMPSDIRAKININKDQLIQKLYHEPGANTLIAGYVSLIFDHSESPYIRNLVRGIFDKFVKEEIVSYAAAQTFSINFVGSIAFLFQDILAESLTNKRLKLGKVIQKPIEALIKYHLP